MKIGVKYTRTDNDGRETEVYIKNRKEQQYHIELEKQGYTYKEIVYSGTCTSCEG